MTPVFAHLMETGFGGFYDGIAHLLITPADLLLVLGLSLLSGQQGPAGGRVLLLVLPLSWLLGGGLGQMLALGDSLEMVSILWFTLIGCLVALAMTSFMVALATIRSMAMKAMIFLMVVRELTLFLVARGMTFSWHMAMVTVSMAIVPTNLRPAALTVKTQTRSLIRR